MTQNPQQTSIAPGCQVTLHYTLSLDDGTEVDSSLGDEPLSFVLGDGTLVHGLEQALLGFQAGDEQCLFIEPEAGFGARDEDNIQRMSRGDFAADLALEPGCIVAFEAPSGEVLPGTVIEISDDEVCVDFNHPLAGRRLVFDIAILEVQPTASEAPSSED